LARSMDPRWCDLDIQLQHSPSATLGQFPEIAF
jgi:hypothetical protein